MLYMIQKNHTGPYLPRTGLIYGRCVSKSMWECDRYEGGKVERREWLRLARFSLAWLEAGQPPDLAISSDADARQETDLPDG